MSESGVLMELVYKKETTWGVPAGPAGGQKLPRVSVDLDLDKNTYQSKRIKPSMQVSDFRHGIRKVAGNYTDELACGTFKDFIAAGLRQAWQTAPTTGAITTVTASATAPHFVRSAGSFITDGFRVGQIVAWTGWATTGTANNAKYFIITTLTATQMTVIDLALNTSPVAAKAAGDSVTCTLAGRQTWMPQTGHTADAFDIERRYLTLNKSELLTGCMVDTLDFDVKPDDMVGISIGFKGKDRIRQSGLYYTAPTAADTNRTFGSAIGIIRAGGTTLAILTSQKISIKGALQENNPILTSTISEIFRGRLTAGGQFDAYLADTTFRDAFQDETEMSMQFYLSADSGVSAATMGFNLPRIKLGKVPIQDSESMLVQNVPFTALELDTGTGADQTTIAVQDTTLP